MLTDVFQRYSRQYSYHVFHYAFKLIENFPFRISFFILNSSRFFFFFYYYFFLFSIHCCWKSLFLYCVNLIEFILRDVTGCHSLEFLNAIRNKESVENDIISHFWFCLPSPLKSPWSSDAVHFHENFLAVHGSMLYWFMNILDAVLSCLCDRWNSFRRLFGFCASPYEPSNWSVCFKYLKLVCGQMFHATLFLWSGGSW